MKNVLVLVLVCVGAAALGMVSQAAVVSVTGAGTIVSPPVSLMPTAFANKNVVYAINEQANVSWSGGFDRYLPTIGFTYTLSTLSSANPGPIVVNSHILHFDNQGTPTPYPTVTGTVTFDRPIIGIIATNTRLDASDAALGNPGTTYPFGVGNRGMSSTIDSFRLLSATTLEFTFANGGAMDQIRVLTVPGPGTAALAAFGLFGAIRRRR